MATQLSRKRRSRDNKLTELLWEPDDSYVLTPTDIANGWFEHTLIHPRIVYRLLVRCKVNAGEYAHTSMVVNEDTGLVHVTLGGWETVDETVRFQYYYRHGGRLVPAEPTPFEYVVPQFIYAYNFNDGAEYADQSTPGSHLGQSIPDWEPTMVYRAPMFGAHQSDTLWVCWKLPDDWGTFEERGVTGFKVRANLDGSGRFEWHLNIDNPEFFPGPGLWPGGNTEGSHITLDNDYDPFPDGIVVVSGPQTYEYEFATSDTASDPAYEGASYEHPLSDLEVSLNQPIDITTNTFYVASDLHPLDPSSGIVLHSFDLVLTGFTP